MSLSFPTLSIPSWDSSTSRPIPQCSSSLNVSAGSLQVSDTLRLHFLGFCKCPFEYIQKFVAFCGLCQVVTKNSGGGAGSCRRFCGLKLWLIKRFNVWKKNREFGPLKDFMTINNQSLPDGQLFIVNCDHCYLRV